MPYSNPDQAASLSDLFSLKGRSAVVVGGSGLLGGEITFALAELGASLIIASRDAVKCEDFAQRVMKRFPQARATGMAVDITDPTSIRALFGQAGAHCGGSLDILVNSGWSGRKNTFESISDEDWNRDIEVCLNGVFRTIKAAFPLMREKGGAILNISSMYGHVAPDYRMYDSERFANPPSYGAAKAGIIQLTRYLASFLSPHRIRANCISPGPFPFESTQQANPDFIDRLAAKNPLNRIGQPHDLKGAAALLCSDASAYMTGQNICVDGGWGVW